MTMAAPVARGSSSFKVTDQRAARRAAWSIVRSQARQVMAEARDDTPVGKSGNLRAGWRVTPASDYDSRVVNAVPYARYVEFGTKRQAPRAMLGKAVARARARQR